MFHVADFIFYLIAIEFYVFPAQAGIHIKIVLP